MQDNETFYENQDIFYGYDAWPIDMQRLGAKPHLNHREGFKLFLFFVSNGVSPQQAAEWLKQRHTYDREHNGKEADILVQRYEAGLLQNYSAYDIGENRQRNFFDPHEVKTLDKEYVEDVNWEFINSFDNPEKQAELHELKNKIGEFRFATNHNYLYDDDEAWITSPYEYVSKYT